MLKNPDIQPNATINRWIATILLFDFKLVHMPAEKHRGPDSLLRCEPADGEDKEDDPEEWINNILSLGLWVVSWTLALHTDHCSAVWTFSVELPATADFTADSPSIPINDKACKANEQIKLIQHYLSTLQQPSHLNDLACAHLLR